MDSPSLYLSLSLTCPQPCCQTKDNFMLSIIYKKTTTKYTDRKKSTQDLSSYWALLHNAWKSGPVFSHNLVAHIIACGMTIERETWENLGEYWSHTVFHFIKQPSLCLDFALFPQFTPLIHILSFVCACVCVCVHALGFGSLGSLEHSNMVPSILAARCRHRYGGRKRRNPAT